MTLPPNKAVTPVRLVVRDIHYFLLVFTALLSPQSEPLHTFLAIQTTQVQCLTLRLLTKPFLQILSNYQNYSFKSLCGNTRSHDWLASLARRWCKHRLSRFNCINYVVLRLRPNFYFTYMLLHYCYLCCTVLCVWQSYCICNCFVPLSQFILACTCKRL